MSTATVFACRPLTQKLELFVKYKCVSCKQKFDKRTDYENHRKEVHGTTNQSQGSVVCNGA